MDKEDGEMSDDNVMQVDDIATDNKVIYKDETDVVLVENLGKVDPSKLKERATRFGLNLTGNRVITQPEIDELYTNFGVESGNERHFRFDTLHLKGVSDLDTREIFEYLEDYKPVSLEWVDDTSCNIVCQDHISVALALLVHSREIKNDTLKNMLKEKSTYHWREGMPHPKKDLILMRFATNGDKKVAKTKPNFSYEEYWDPNSGESKNPWGDLCKSWGIYDHQEVFNRKLDKGQNEENKLYRTKNKSLATRLGKRKQSVEESNESSNSDSEWTRKSKAPRMRMHADDEESKQKKVQIPKSDGDSDSETFAPLSIEIDNSKTTYVPRESSKLSDKFKSYDKNNKGQKGSILSRLGKKLPKSNEHTDSDEEEINLNIMSKVQKVKTNEVSSVWSRLENNKSTVQSDLRQVIKSKKNKKHDDLRDIIGKIKR